MFKGLLWGRRMVPFNIIYTHIYTTLYNLSNISYSCLSLKCNLATITISAIFHYTCCALSWIANDWYPSSRLFAISMKSSGRSTRATPWTFYHGYYPYTRNTWVNSLIGQRRFVSLSFPRSWNNTRRPWTTMHLLGMIFELIFYK